MREYTLPGSQITDKKELHRQLAAIMEFPEWYGYNLDALNDVLTDIGEDTRLIIIDSEMMKENLGEYHGKLLRVLDRIQEENPYFFFELQE